MQISGLKSKKCYSHVHCANNFKIKKFWEQMMDCQEKSLIFEASKKITQIEKDKQVGENFNIFSILERDNAETRHSRLLAELLNPKGAHDQGSLFLKKFITLFTNEDLGDFYDTAHVVTEQSHCIDGKQSYIDIVIETEDRAIIIENKIFAPDQWEQLKRYAKAKETKNNFIVYLTPHGTDASENSQGELEVINLSYKDHITKWLEDSKASVTSPNIVIILNQYQALIEKITNKNTTRENIELSALLLEDGNMQTALKLSESISWAKANIEMEFFKNLKDTVADDLKTLGFEFYQGKDFDQNDIKWITDIRKANAKTDDNGLTALYFYKKLSDKKNIFLRFGVDKEYCLWLDCFLGENITNKKSIQPLKSIQEDWTIWKKSCILLECEKFPGDVNFTRNEIFIKTKKEREELARKIGQMSIDILKGDDFKGLLSQLEI